MNLHEFLDRVNAYVEGVTRLRDDVEQLKEKLALDSQYDTSELEARIREDLAVIQDEYQDVPQAVSALNDFDFDSLLQNAKDELKRTEDMQII